MSFENELGQLNECFFFREFTFSKNTFRPSPEQEVELADNIVWLDDQLIVFQLKEREAPENPNAESEGRWFDRKVITQGTRQIRDTLAYLGVHEQIELENHRGHRFRLRGAAIATIHKVICFLPHEALPDERRSRKFHRSQTAGIIHLIPANDYLGIVQTLLTPHEVSEYLSFREELVEGWEAEVDALPEQALLGQYLSGNADAPPNLDYIEYLAALEHRSDEWDMSGVIKELPDRVTTDNEPTDYYNIVIEIAKLKRNELREFKKRFQLSMEKARADDFVQPYRMACPRTNCGFVFIPLVKEFVVNRQQGLKNLTYACKYDFGLPKCLGVCFVAKEGGWYSVEWCYMEFPWERDEEMDKRLKEDSPFRKVKTKELGRYTYKEEE